MKFLKKTREDVLTLSANNANVVKWHADASFAVHQDMKSHTGITMSMGEGVMYSSSRKQKMNSRSSTEAELIAADDAITHIMWTKLFLEAQGYPTKNTILKQDNTSTMQLEKNGKSSSHKRTRHINIRYFYIKDHLDKGEFKLEYCSTDNMLADYMTKPLQGATFEKFRKQIMNFE